MNIRRFNWHIWAGFLLSIIAFLSYGLFFVNFPITRDVPWANLILFLIAASLLFVGIRRAFAPDRSPPGESRQFCARFPRCAVNGFVHLYDIRPCEMVTGFGGRAASGE